MRSDDSPVRQVCRVLAYARSRHYYRPRVRVETTRQAALGRLVEAWPTYGYRRITAVRRRADFQVNRKPGARLMRDLGLQGQRPRRRPRTTHRDPASPRSPHLVQGLTVVRPAHVWVGDLTSGRLRHEFVYRAVCMDIDTRGIGGWQLSRHLDQRLTLTALRRALAQHRPASHHSDQGVQYAATAYLHTLQAHGSQISMAAIGEATADGDAERLMRTMKEEEVPLHD
jgi:putative transposase